MVTSQNNGPKIVEGKLEAKGLKFAIAVSRFNHFIVDRLVEGCLDTLTRHGCDVGECVLVRVPGAFELPVVVKKLAAKKAIIPTWGYDDLNPEDAKIGLSGSPTKVNKVFAPPIKLNKEILSGEPADMVKELIFKLREKKVI